MIACANHKAQQHPSGARAREQFAQFRDDNRRRRRRRAQTSEFNHKQTLKQSTISKSIVAVVVAADAELSARLARIESELCHA